MVPTIETCEDLVAQIDALGVAGTVKAHRKPPLPTRILRDLYELYHDQDRYLSFLAYYPLIPSDLADQIAANLEPDQVDIAIGLAGNPRCPQQTLHRLIDHPEMVVRHALAANANLTTKEIQSLVQDDNEFVRAALATNPALPNHLQFILADDASTAVRIALTERKNLDTDVAVHLAQSSDALVSAATILNCTLDDELLQLWADCQLERQQLLLLKRTKAVPETVRAALRTSTHPLVCRTALKDCTLSGPEMLYLAQSEDTRDRIFLADQSDLPASIQRLLAQDASPRVRSRLAANNTIQDTIALHIVASNDLSPARALAKNPATSQAALRELCLHPEDDIALLIAYREDLLPEHLDLLINHRASLKVAEHLAYQGIEYSNFSEDVARQLARHDAPSIRSFAARSVQLDDATRSQLARDPSPEVRRKLAENPALSEQQLRDLLKDHDRDVVFAAEENFAQRIRKEKDANSPETMPEEATTPARQPRKGAFFNTIANFFND